MGDISVTKWRRLSVLGVFLGLSSVLAEAEDAATIADVRCVVVGMKMASSPQQTQGIVLTWYYIGRLEGRVPVLNLENLLIAEIDRMTGADLTAEGRRCVTALADKGLEVAQIGKDLLEREKKTAAQAPKH